MKKVVIEERIKKLEKEVEDLKDKMAILEMKIKNLEPVPIQPPLYPINPQPYCPPFPSRDIIWYSMGYV